MEAGENNGLALLPEGNSAFWQYAGLTCIKPVRADSNSNDFLKAYLKNKQKKQMRMRGKTLKIRQRPSQLSWGRRDEKKRREGGIYTVRSFRRRWGPVQKSTSNRRGD